jgi:hypothetical protein
LTQASFVKRAPEIAEGILAKMAALPILPDGLRSFSKDLLTKEASTEEEKLQAPKRMSLAELQKLASGNKVDLPKVAAVSTDSSSEIADALKKIAARHEEENAEDVFASAAAIVAHQKEAISPTAVGELSAAVKKLSPTKKEKSFFGLPVKHISPGTLAHGKTKAQKRLLSEATPGDILHGEAHKKTRDIARATAEGEAGKELQQTIRGVGKGLPALGIGTAAAVTAPAVLAPAKREKIQVVK